MLHPLGQSGAGIGDRGGLINHFTGHARHCQAGISDGVSVLIGTTVKVRAQRRDDCGVRGARPG
jgi:hypothetical protein